MDGKRSLVKAIHLEVDGTKKGEPKKRWKEVQECDMIARSLQRLDVQDRERWQLGCENRLTPACEEHLLSTQNRKCTSLEQNDDDDYLFLGLSQ